MANWLPEEADGYLLTRRWPGEGRLFLKAGQNWSIFGQKSIKNDRKLDDFRLFSKKSDNFWPTFGKSRPSAIRSAAGGADLPPQVTNLAEVWKICLARVTLLILFIILYKYR